MNTKYNQSQKKTTTRNITKHCPQHNGPKAVSTLTHTTPLVQSKSFKKLWNVGQTSALLAKCEKYIYVEEIHVKTLTNPCSDFALQCINFGKSI